MDSKPRWSPDGTKIAFPSNRNDKDQPQIYVIPFGGGEARQLTNMKGEFGTFKWSPGGEQFVCQFGKKAQEAIEHEQYEQKNELGVVSRGGCTDRRIARLNHILRWFSRYLKDQE